MDQDNNSSNPRNMIMYQIEEESVKEKCILMGLKTSNIYAATEC